MIINQGHVLDLDIKTVLKAFELYKIPNVVHLGYLQRLMDAFRTIITEEREKNDLENTAEGKK